MALNAWASPISITAEVRSWLDMRMRDMSPGCDAARAIAKAISGTEPTKPPRDVAVTPRGLIEEIFSRLL
jgi:hypothetical protein